MSWVTEANWPAADGFSYIMPRSLDLEWFKEVKPGTDPMKKIKHQFTLLCNFMILSGLKWPHELKQPMGMIEFQRRVNMV